LRDSVDGVNGLLQKDIFLFCSHRSQLASVFVYTVKSNEHNR
jgi:hypothetical protein